MINYTNYTKYFAVILVSYTDTGEIVQITSVPSSVYNVYNEGGGFSSSDFRIVFDNRSGYTVMVLFVNI